MDVGCKHGVVRGGVGGGVGGGTRLWRGQGGSMNRVTGVAAWCKVERGG